MEVIRDPAAMNAAARRWLRQGLTLGFVPTMGNLHEGHLSLMRRAVDDNDLAIASIFVNPLQFGPSEDLASYPRTLEDDLAAAGDAGVDVVFTPTDDTMYPPGFATRVEVDRLTERLCGAARPGHFRGVTTVVMKLFCLTLPHRAYFGEKDYQQLAVIRRMADDMGLGVDVVGMPIVREADGLAMSSRNQYLNGPQREAATCLYRGLETARQLVADGETRGDVLEAAAAGVIEREPGVDVEYVELVHPDTLEPLDRLDSSGRMLVAARLGAARLIDNMALSAGA